MAAGGVKKFQSSFVSLPFVNKYERGGGRGGGDLVVEW